MPMQSLPLICHICPILLPQLSIIIVGMKTSLFCKIGLLAALLTGFGPAHLMGSPAGEEPRSAEGFLYGLVLTSDNAVYEGRLRFGRDEEALWSNYFNGVKDHNPWAHYVPADQLTTLRPFEIFGLEFGSSRRQIDLERPLMIRFGDIARIDAAGRELTVTLRSGSVIELDRYEADDFADGLRIWDRQRGLIELGEWPVRSIQFRPTPPLEDVPVPLYGTVHTALGPFRGLIQWDRESCLGSDKLTAYAADREESVRFDAVHTIWRHSDDSSRVLLRDGRELLLSGTRAAGHGNRGIYVDDPRYGRILVSWDAFRHVEFIAADKGQIERAPAYSDFPVGRPLTGNVATRGGRRLTGRIIYDLDESETTQTLDAPLQGVNFTIPFGLIASIKLADSDQPGTEQTLVVLHSGERLQLERQGDLGPDNAGLLILSDDGQGPEYVPWTDLDEVNFDRPSAMYPPFSSIIEFSASSSLIRSRR